jgi:crossover junction endodeoxyribonuclease RuvC
MQKELEAFVPSKMIIIFLERYAYGARAGQAFSIGEWGGVLRVLLDEMKFKEVFEVSPPTLKKYITGHGNAKKEQMLLQTFKRYKIEFQSNDLCDAYGLARMNWARDNQSKLLKHEKEALQTVMEYNKDV